MKGDSRKMPGNPSFRHSTVTAVALLVQLTLLLLAFCAPTSTKAFIMPLHQSPQGGARKFPVSLAAASSRDLTPCLLITFDLDDTLFPIQEVVDAANDAQIEAMHRLGYTDTSMELCMVQTKAIRQALSAPITYTDLRKGAIRAELERSVDFSSKSSLLDEQVEHCFDAWLQARHDASERHLFPEAIPALQEIQGHFSASDINQAHNVCLGAITNGRGNPLCMTSTLAPYFEFCVSGEDEDVFPHRKPHSKIYEAALKRWRLLLEDASDNNAKKPDLWVHIGDCLANDVGASHDAGARAIWVVQPEEEGDQPSWSTATEEEKAKRALLMEGARSKMSGQINNLSELKGVIQSLLNE